LNKINKALVSRRDYLSVLIILATTVYKWINKPLTSIKSFALLPNDHLTIANIAFGSFCFLTGKLQSSTVKVQLPEQGIECIFLKWI